NSHLLRPPMLLLREAASSLRLSRGGLGVLATARIWGHALVSRVRNSPAFGSRCIPAHFVTPPLNTIKVFAVVAPRDRGASAASVLGEFLTRDTSADMA